MTKEDLIKKELRIIDNEIKKYRCAIDILENSKKSVENKIRNMNPEEFKKEKEALKDYEKRYKRV